MVARRVAVAAAAPSANVARGIPVAVNPVAGRVPDVALDNVRRDIVARAVALRFIGVVFQVTVRPRFGQMVARLVAEAAAVRVERAGFGPDVRGSALARRHVTRHLTRCGIFAASRVCVGVVAGSSGRRLQRVVAVRVAEAAAVGADVAFCVPRIANCLAL